LRIRTRASEVGGFCISLSAQAPQMKKQIKEHAKDEINLASCAFSWRDAKLEIEQKNVGALCLFQGWRSINCFCERWSTSSHQNCCYCVFSRLRRNYIRLQVIKLELIGWLLRTHIHEMKSYKTILELRCFVLVPL
jgi:hypothetical protein